MKKKIYTLNTQSWYIERAVYLMAGIFILLSVILAVLINTNILYFTAFIGIMLINFALTGYCPMSILLGKLGMQRKIQ